MNPIIIVVVGGVAAIVAGIIIEWTRRRERRRQYERGVLRRSALIYNRLTELRERDADALWAEVMNERANRHADNPNREATP